VISAKLATLHELQTLYGTKDLYDLLEIAAVDAYNAWLAQQRDDD
jgi:hypothetical protein